MAEARGASRPLTRRPTEAALWAAGGAALGSALLIGWAIAARPDLYRPMLSLALIAILGLTALRWPNIGILATLLLLPFIGLFRRLLIESTGWPESDPLLLIGPVIAVVLFVKAYVLDSAPLFTDLLSKLVLAFIGLAVLGLVNPLGAGIASGAAALFLTTIPLVWFYVGRALPTRATIRQLQYGTIFVAAGVAAYGLYQTEIGFPTWDRAWVNVGGYAALSVGDQLRGWGTMASASEYAAYVGAGVVFAIAATRDRAWAWVILPLLTVALLLSSVRSIFVLVIVATLLILGLMSRNPRLALPIVAVAAVAVYTVGAPALAQLSASTGSELLSHQLGGLTDPLNEESSTLSVHMELIGNGITEGVKHPLGQGIAPEAVADRTDFTYRAGTEFDVSDAFIYFGATGGLLFVALVGLILATLVRRYLSLRDPLVLGALGIGIVAFGGWLNGGHYALTPLLWFLFGWATRPERVEPGSSADTARR